MMKQSLRRLLPILLLLAALILPASGLAEDVTAYLSGLTASVTQNGVPVTGGTLTDDPVKVRFSFGVPVEGDEPVPVNPVRKGDYAEFELSSGFSLESGSEYVLRSGDDIVGHVEIITEEVGGVKRVKARVVFDGDDDVFNGELHTVSCYFNAKFSYDGSGSGGGTGEDTVSILNKEYTVVIPPGEITYRVLKRGEVNLADGTITWKATVNAVQGGTPIDLGGYIFEDDLIGAGVYETGTFAVGDASQTPTYEEDKLTYTFPAGVGPKTITYQTKIPDEKYYAFGEQTLTNRAALKDSDERELKSDEATVTFDPGWIVKSGASNETPGGVYNPKDRTITWTIDITNPDPNTPMKGVKVTDTLPAGLTFASATVAYKTGPNESDWGTSTSIAPSEDVYTLSDDVSHAARLVIVATVPDDTYTVGVTTYTNSASVSWDGLPVGINGIGTGGVGVGIGFVPISKSGTANTATGLVTWTVNVDTRGQNIPDLKVYDLLGLWG